ncbi:MAG: YqcI/YcgG family protein [Chloroflexi bacterium]|nr:YqcI/YcgG family protein [Chloroflexota bacterium]
MAEARSLLFLDASVLVLIIQTRENLTGIVGKERVADRVRGIIRSVVKTYDSIPVSPDLGPRYLW